MPHVIVKLWPGRPDCAWLGIFNSDNPIRLCKHCTKSFVASRPSAVFCSPQCKNKYNVYKSRAKDKKEGWERKRIYDRQMDCRSNGM